MSTDVEEYYVCRIKNGYTRDGFLGITGNKVYNYLYLSSRRDFYIPNGRRSEGVHYYFVLTHEISKAKKFKSVKDSDKMLTILSFALEDGYAYYDVNCHYKSLECVKVRHILREESFEVVEED